MKNQEIFKENKVMKEYEIYHTLPYVLKRNGFWYTLVIRGKKSLIYVQSVYKSVRIYFCNCISQ